MKDGETVLIDLGTGVLRLNKWNTISGPAFAVTLMVPALVGEHYMSPAESCSTSFNAAQAARIVAALTDDSARTSGEQHG